MKSLVLILLVALLPNIYISQAARQGSPFQPHDDKRFDVLEDELRENPAKARKYAKIIYDASVDGGASATNYDLGVKLPAGALITSMFAYVNTLFVEAGGGGGTGSVAFQCAGTRDLLEYQDLSSFPVKSYLNNRIASGSFGAGQLVLINQIPRIQPVGSSVATACNVTAVVRGSSGDEAYTAGKLTMIIEYFNVD